MKNFLCLFSVFILTLSSCSSEDSKDEIETILTKPTKISTITLSTGAYTSIDFKYNGNKLESETYYDGTVVKYTYAGNLIAKKENSKDGKVQFTREYAYTNGKLVSRTIKYSNSKSYSRTKYIHAANSNVIDIEEYSVSETGIEDKLNVWEQLTYKNGNLIQSKYGDTNSQSTVLYEYDTKVNPLSNITGRSLLLDNYHESSSNNITKISEGTDILNYEYLYNADDSPRQRKPLENPGSSAYISYFYN